MTTVELFRRDAATHEENPKQTALNWAAAYNRHDPDDAAAFYSDQVTNVQLPWANAVHGRAAMRSTFVKVFEAFPDIKVELENVFGEGPWVAVEWRFKGTMVGEFAGHPPNNSSFEMRGCEVFQVAGGKIVAQRGYWDKATMFAQLGINGDC